MGKEKDSPKKKKLNAMEDFAELAYLANSDVLGSYTGSPQDPDDLVPVQDVDDL